MKKAPKALKKVEGLKMQISLGDTVKRIRKVSRVSQQDLADLLSIHQTAVSRVESGQQNLLPWQLMQLSEFFGIRVDAILEGRINYWALAEKFGLHPPLPQHYRDAAFSKVREALPLLQFVASTKGEAYRDKLLSGFGLDVAYFSEPDQPLGVHCTLDIFRHLMANKVLSEANFSKLVDHTRTEEVQGFLHPIYQTQEAVIPLIMTWVMNAHHYESNFQYQLEGMNKNSIDLSINPASHMKKISYADETLGDVLCRYKKEYLTQFPKYIGRKPVELVERECHFHGAQRCIYTISAA